MKVYIVFGYEKLYGNDSLEKIVYGACSTEEKAEELAKAVSLMSFVEYAEVESVTLDDPTFLNK